MKTSFTLVIGILIVVATWQFWLPDDDVITPGDERLTTNAPTPVDSSAGVEESTEPGRIESANSPDGSENGASSISICLQKFITSNDPEAYFSCIGGIEYMDPIELHQALISYWHHLGGTEYAYELAFERFRDSLPPAILIEVWRRSRASIAKEEGMGNVVDFIWVTVPPRSAGDLDGLTDHLEAVLRGEIKAIPGTQGEEIGTILMGIGVTEGTAERAYALHLIEKAFSSMTPKDVDARLNSIYAVFNLNDNPIQAGLFLSENLWNATDREIGHLLRRISSNMENGQMSPTDFEQVFESIASIHSDTWAQLQDKGFDQPGLSDEIKQYLTNF
ncbi:MAG: hypothetical protein HQ519_04025 [Planctomycetes bacterium]|nr:hypothetical protein [Planctomycetota bacterium]